MATQETIERELATTFYTNGRAEIVQRLALREQVLLASLTVSGVLVGLGFRTNPPDFRLLSLIPLFTLPFVVIHVRHNMIIEYIGEYFDEELQPFLFGCVESKTLSSPKHWDQSSNLKHRLASFLRYEAAAHFLFLCGPALFVLWIAWDQRNTMSSLYWPGLVLTSVATLIVFWQFVRGDPFSNFWHS
jgi:hypothetical protein